MHYQFCLQDIRRSFANKGFVDGVCGLGALLSYNYITESMGSGDPYYAIVNILAISGFTIFLPVFPVLGYSSRFCGEYESGYYRLILSRMKPQAYARARIISVALSGGAIVAVPYLLTCLAAVCLETPELTGLDFLRVEADVEMVVIGRTYGLGAMVAVKVLLGFLAGSTWALVGLAFAVWIPNRYVSLIAPFVLYQSHYILLPDFLSPALLVRGDDVGHLLSVLVECVWLAAAVAATMAGFRRRCRDE